MTQIQRTLLALAAILAIAAVCPRVPRSLHADVMGNRPSDAVVAKGNEVLKRVSSETKANSHKADAWPWSGQYYAGDGLGFNLRLAIAPKAGVVYWSHGCFGLYALNYGTFREKDGRIHLSFEEKGIEDPDGLHPVLIPVRWGDRRYLIPENEMIDFCNHINSGSQAILRTARFCRHVDDAKKRTSGIPKVPQKYRPYLLKEPIDAEVVWIGKTVILKQNDRWPPGKYRVTEVRLNRGKGNGLLPGMELYHPEFPDMRVIDVSASSCRAEASKRLLEQESADVVGAPSDPSRATAAGDQDPSDEDRGDHSSEREGVARLDKEPQMRLGLHYSTRSPDSAEHSSGNE